MPLKTYIEPIIEIRLSQAEKEGKFAQLKAMPRQVFKEKEDKYRFVPITFSELLKEDGRDYMIIADSGLGKTSFFRWLEVQVASRTIKPSTEYIPVFIQFTEMATINTYNDLINLIETKFPREADLKSYIQTKWKEGKLLFLIDGLDQVFDTAIISEKLRSKDIYGKNKVIFTSRPLGYEKNKYSFEGRYEYLRICPFDSERIMKYVQENYNKPQFQRVLKENKELLAIPQLLKMTRTLLVSRPEEFAHIKTRSDLYERFIHHLIREESRRYGTQDIFAHAEEIKRDLVTVSYSVMKSGNLGSFTIEEAIKYLDNNGGRLTRLLQWSITHNLTERGGRKEVIYRHQSFQEYLASLKLKEKIFENSRINEEVIIDHLEYLYWNEVWLFLVGGLEYKQAREVINYLEKYDHYLAALCVRAYKGNREDFKSLIDGLFKEIHDSKARDVLVKIADTEIETKWIELLKDDDPGVRGYAAEALGEIKSEKAVEPLIGLLKDKDEDLGIRRVAAFALGEREIKSEKAVEPLSELLKDEEPGVRDSVAWALGGIKSEKAVEPLIGLLKGDDSVICISAAKALGKIKPEKAVELLIGLLKDKDEDPEIRRVAAFALGEREIKSAKAVELLIGLLKDDDPIVRGYAAFALGEIKSENAIESLIGLLKDKDEDPYVHRETTQALGKIESTKAVEPLIGLLKDEDLGVRGYAAWALGEIKSEKAVEPLIELLKDVDSGVRGSAARALGKIESEKAVEPLIGLLKDVDSEVRGSAAVALGNISTILNASDQDKLILQLFTSSREKDIPTYYGYIDAIEQIKEATGRRFLRIINAHPQRRD